MDLKISKIQKEYKRAKVSEISPYKHNNKRHGENVVKIVESMQATGYLTPIIVDENNEILAGHGRREALIRLGQEEVDVLQVSGLSEKQKRDFRLRDNKLTELSERDFDAIKFELDELQIPELTDLFDFKEMEAIMETKQEIKEEREKENEPVAQEDDFEIPEAEEIKTDIVIGDLFEIGEHRLLCGDSTDKEQVAKLMNGEKADMVFTDPPYGYSYESNHQKKHKELKNDDKILDFLPNAIGYTKENSAMYMFGGRQTIYEWMQEIKKTKLSLKNIIVWKKNNWSMGDLTGAYAGQYEIIFFLHKGRVELLGERFRDVWEFDRVPPTDHPTKKPVELCERGIKSSCPENGLVIDFFLGSGSTMVAGHQLKRKVYGLELDPKYCQVIIDRMKALDPNITIKKNGLLLK